MIVSLFLALSIAILACVFALQNSALVSVVFLSGRFTHSLALILMATFGLGVLVGFLVMLPAYLRKTWQLSAHKKEMRRRAEIEESEEEAEYFS